MGSGVVLMMKWNYEKGSDRVDMYQPVGDHAYYSRLAEMGRKNGCPEIREGEHTWYILPWGELV
jgi:hypothetical protein